MKKFLVNSIIVMLLFCAGWTLKTIFCILVWIIENTDKITDFWGRGVAVLIIIIFFSIIFFKLPTVPVLIGAVIIGNLLYLFSEKALCLGGS